MFLIRKRTDTDKNIWLIKDGTNFDPGGLKCFKREGGEATVQERASSQKEGETRVTFLNRIFLSKYELIILSIF